MPFIDPSVLLLDPEFTTRFAVVQRTQNVDVNGTVSTTDTTKQDVLGVILPTNPTELKRYKDKEFGQRTLKLITQFHLNSAAVTRDGKQRLPDRVLYQRDAFLVVDLKPYIQYGPGWVLALITSIDAVEATT